MALLGSSVDPRLFVQDYSGFTRAAKIQAQGMQNLGAAIGQGIKDFGEARQERKKLDAGIKANRKSIESALKLGESLGIDVSSLNPILEQMDDPNTTPMEAAALGQAGAQRITDTLNLGIDAQDRRIKLAQAGAESDYRDRMAAASETRAAASLLGARAAAQPNYTFQEYNVKNPLTGEDEKSKLPVNPKTGRPRDIEVNRDILNVQDWYENKGGLAPEEPAMPTPTSQVMPSDGKFGFTYKTRDLLPASTPNARQISLDFNAAANKNAKGIEIIIPNNASDIERALALDYVNKTKDFFSSKGVDVPVRGVRTAAENKRGSSNRFHTEPFFVNDAASRAAIESDPDGYAQVLASTIGKIPGAMFIPPHKSNDPGASANGINERDFAKGVLIPALERLSTQGGVTAMGTPQQQAEVARMIEEGQGMAMAQNMPQGAMPTEPSMATQQPQLPQQAAPKVNLRPGFAPVRPQGQAQFRQATPEEVATYGTQGQVNTATGEFRPIRPPSGMVIEQTKDGGFRVVQGAGAVGRQEQAAQAAKEQGVERATMGTQEIGRALKVLDSGVTQGSGPLASFYRAGAAKFVKGTPEYKLANDFIAPIKSMLAFNELNKMRMSSPTGGALGNVAKFETDMLQQSAGQLDIDKTDPQTLRENLMRLQEKYLDVIHGSSEQRRKLLQEGKITKEQYFDIESSYPAFTMSATGETVPRQMEGVTPQAQESEADRILRELGE